MNGTRKNLLIVKVEALVKEIGAQPDKVAEIMARTQREAPEVVMALARAAGKAISDGPEVLAASLEARAQAGIGGMLISNSMDEHFDVIVEAMNMAGATRLGSSNVSVAGRSYIVDNYSLPNGHRVKAGYEG